MPAVNRAMGDSLEGFFPWLAEDAPDLYARIKEAETLIDSLWLSSGDQQSFKDACRSWHDLLVEAKKKFDAHKAEKTDELMKAGRQERLAV